MSKIRIRDLTYEYESGGQRFKALDRINLEVEEGEFVCIAGHSGCGKSTLLKLVAGLLSTGQGSVQIDGAEVKGPGLDRSVVFQHDSLFPWLTAKKNVMFGIHQAFADMTKEAVRQRALEVLSQVGLSEAADKYPYQLSGGMQQRVAIARAFAMNGSILLMDEPFGALDPRIRCTLQEMLERLWDGEGRRKTVLFVTHDTEEAIVLADRIVFMKPGRVCDQIKVDFPRPRNRRQLMQTAECCAVRKELIELFYKSQE